MQAELIVPLNESGISKIFFKAEYLLVPIVAVLYLGIFDSVNFSVLFYKSVKNCIVRVCTDY